MEKAEIFYVSSKNKLSQSFIVKMYVNPTVTMDDFNKYYMKIYETNIPNTINIENEKSLNQYLESLYNIFNSDKNPLSAPFYQKIIKNNKLHTSMSMSDVIKIGTNYYYAAGFGFHKITN